MAPIAVVLVGIVLLAMGLRFPVLPVLLAVPATFLVLRVGGAGGGNNLSLADVILAVATVAALPLVTWSRTRRLKQLFVLVLIYQWSTLFSIIDHPNRYDTVEWFHQLLLVAGSAVVGYVIVDRNCGKQALSVFLIIATALSLWVVEEFAAHGFYSVATLPGGLQKNLLGDLFVAAVLIAHIKPDWSRLEGRWVQWTKYTCVIGVIASGSRQSMITLTVVIGVVYLSRRGLSKRSRLLVAALIPVGVAAYVTISDQVSSTQINSLSIRSLAYHQTIALWQQYPLFGVGERFWYTGLYLPKFQPPNAEISMLATGGIVGLLGFLVLIFGSLRLLWRLPAAAGTLAFAVLLAHAIDGQFDIFWVSASGSLPWMIAGMGLAAASGPQQREDSPPSRMAQSNGERVGGPIGNRSARLGREPPFVGPLPSGSQNLGRSSEP